MRHGMSCSECPSACCRQGTILPLTHDEAWSLIEAGSGLESYPEDEKHSLTRRQRRRGISFYKLDTDCGNLQLPEDGGAGKCDAFGSPERPLICREFTVGDLACRTARIENGLDSIPKPGVA